MSFLEKLQSAPEAAKRRWIIAATAAIMVAVIYIWLAYFNTLLTAGFSSPANSSPAGSEQMTQPPSTAGGSNVTFWQTLKNSVANLYAIFTEKLRDLGNILNAPREYIIKPPQ